MTYHCTALTILDHVVVLRSFVRLCSCFAICFFDSSFFRPFVLSSVCSFYFIRPCDPSLFQLSILLIVVLSTINCSFIRSFIQSIHFSFIRPLLFVCVFILSTVHSSNLLFLQQFGQLTGIRSNVRPTIHSAICSLFIHLTANVTWHYLTIKCNVTYYYRT